MNEDMRLELDYLKDRLREDNPALAGESLIGAAFTLFKKRYKKSGKDWTVRDSVAAGMPIASFYDLSKSGNSDDAGNERESIKEAFLNDPDKFFIEAAAEIVPEADENIREMEHAKLKNKTPEDFIVMKSVLATSLPYVNANGDAFSAADLEEAVKDGQLGGNCPAIVDWLHDFCPYGTTIKAEVQENTVPVDYKGEVKEEKVTQIVVYSVFWAWLYAEKAAAIRQWHRENKLRFSMACSAKKRQYVEEEGRYYRLLGKPTFYANSIIAGKYKPADANAVPIEVAGLDDVETKFFMPELHAAGDINNGHNNNGDNDMTLEEALKLIEDLKNEKKDLAAKIEQFEKSDAEKSIADLTEKNEGLQADLDTAEEANKELAAENEELKKSVEDLETANSEMVEQIREYRKDEVDQLNAKVASSFNEVPGLSDEQKTHWIEKHRAELDEDGSVNFDNDAFESDLAALPKAKEKKESGKMVKASAEAGKVVTQEVVLDPEDDSPMV